MALIQRSGSTLEPEHIDDHIPIERISVVITVGEPCAEISNGAADPYDLIIWGPPEGGCLTIWAA